MATKINQDIIEDLKMSCTYDPEGSLDKADIYTLPLTTMEIAEGVYKSDIFKPDGLKEEKVIMVVGATGVGKTTLINRMVNYIFDVNYTDTFRFQLIDEKGISQTERQTKDIHKYTIHHKKFPYKITIIDTPGICSTDGKTNYLEKIRYLYESGACTVEDINAICIVEKYNAIRLTENQICIYQAMAQMFGKDVGKVIVIMATFCDDIFDDTSTPKPPQVLQFCKEQHIPFKTHYLFNNKDIYAKPITNVKSLKTQVETAFWNTSTESFRLFFEMLKSTAPVSLNLTKEILFKKCNVKHVLLPNFIKTLNSAIHEIETLEQDRKTIQEMIDNPDTSAYNIEVDVTKRASEDITESNQFSTRCKTCDETCHYPCDIQEDNPIRTTTIWCSSMTWFNPFNIHCTVCQGKCSWKDHEQKKIVRRQKSATEKELGKIKSLKQHFLQGKKETIENGKRICEENMALAYQKVLKEFKEIQNDIEFVNNNTLSENPTTVKEYLDKFIESEKEAKEEGYIQRIHCMKNLVEMKDELPPLSDIQQAIAFIQNEERTDL